MIRSVNNKLRLSDVVPVKANSCKLLTLYFFFFDRAPEPFFGGPFPCLLRCTSFACRRSSNSVINPGIACHNIIICCERTRNVFPTSESAMNNLLVAPTWRLDQYNIDSNKLRSVVFWRIDNPYVPVFVGHGPGHHALLAQCLCGLPARIVSIC